MKVLVTGANGQLGRELSRLLPARGHETLACARKELDVTDYDAVLDFFETNRPDIVINAAAYTRVDDCEKNRALAYAANALGPRNLAVACERFGCELLQVSTNYVFDGNCARPYEPFDPPNPVNVYGLTKLSGEEYASGLCNRWYIVRTAGVYGDGANFVRTMLRLGAEGKALRVRSDEFISPTYARDLASGIVGIAGSGRYGIYHVVNDGACSWYEFAREIFRVAGMEAEVQPVPSSDYPLPAARPANGVLAPAGGRALRPWQAALQEYLKEELSRRR